MKKIVYSLAALAALTFASCASDDDNNAGSGSQTVSQWTNPLNDTIPYATTQATAPSIDNLLSTYVANVVEPTYQELKDGNAALYNKVVAFQSNQTQANIDAAASEWMKARGPWEKSEAFLFGPVADNDWDPNMDSWPLNRSDIQAIIAQGQVPEATAQDIIGFHTLEYLLYENGQPRDISTNAEYLNNKDNYCKYMKAVAEYLKNDAANLYDAWFGTENYQAQFKSEGNESLNEILQGMWDIANEVGSAKIGEPYALYIDGDTENALYAVESWYSWHSRLDYTNNIRSIKYCYMGQRTEDYGSVTTANANSLSAYVSAKLGVAKDNEMRKAINDAMNAIMEIPDPFRSHINSKEAQVAMEKCAALANVIKDITGKLGLSIDEGEEEE